MGSEAGLWKTLRKNMKDNWEAERVENPASPGTPDVYFTLNTGEMGWTELKHVDFWPKRETTCLKIPHFTKQQRSFLRRHGRKGANVSMVLQVEQDYLLLDWELALQIGTLTKAELIDCAFHWKHRINYDLFSELLKKV